MEILVLMLSAVQQPGRDKRWKLPFQKLKTVDHRIKVRQSTVQNCGVMQNQHYTYTYSYRISMISKEYLYFA